MTSGASLRGSIKDAALVEILQMISDNRASGVFQCVQGPHKLQVYFSDGGGIIHAVSTNRTTGLDALEELAVWNDGTYSFHQSPINVQPSISNSCFNLLTALASKIDEWKVLNRAITSIYLYPYSAILPGEDVELSARETRLMEWCNGHYSVEELALAMGQPITAVAKSLYGLILNDFIELKAVRYPHPPQAAATSNPQAPPAKVPSPALPPARPSTAQTEQDWGFSGVFDPQVILKAASAAPVGDPDSSGGSTGAVTDYLLYANRILDAATQFLPAHLAPELSDLFNKCKVSIMFEGAANLQTLKTLALDINRLANVRMTEGRCDRESIMRYNEEAKRLFGIFKS